MDKRFFQFPNLHVLHKRPLTKILEKVYIFSKQNSLKNCLLSEQARIFSEQKLLKKIVFSLNKRKQLWMVV